MLKVEYVNPFIESVGNLFTTMLGCQAQRGEVNLTRPAKPPTQSVVAIIGMSGSVRGSVILDFPSRTAMRLAHRLLDLKITELDQTVMDAMAEMVNIVAGGAKAKLNSNGDLPANLSLPTVIMSRDYQIEHPSWAVWLDIPFESELGPFNMCVSMETDSAKGGKA